MIRPAIEQMKILDRVVRLVEVDVVYALISSEVSSDIVLHNSSVKDLSFSIISNTLVASVSSISLDFIPR